MNLLHISFPKINAYFNFLFSGNSFGIGFMVSHSPYSLRLDLLLFQLYFFQALKHPAIEEFTTAQLEELNKSSACGVCKKAFELIYEEVDLLRVDGQNFHLGCLVGKKETDLIKSLAKENKK